MEPLPKKKPLKPVSRAKVEPTFGWAAISEDRPPEIWYIGWHRDVLPDYLRHIRVKILPVKG